MQRLLELYRDERARTLVNKARLAAAQLLMPTDVVSGSIPLPASGRRGERNAESPDALTGMCGGITMRDLQLVDSLLAQLEDMEATEGDPDALALLYQLDHFAARMRRNVENLRVLTGHEAGEVAGAASPLVDALIDGLCAQLERMLDLMRRYVPWEYERCDCVELTDGRATLTGGYPPMVRHPVGELPSGGPVLGMGDVVVTNDPVTAQGSNSASKCAASYLTSILERGDEPFDAAWMQQAFDRYWSDAQHPTMWTNVMLAPPPEHATSLLAAAATHPEIAHRFVNGFADTSDFQHWLLDPDKAEHYLASVVAGES